MSRSNITSAMLAEKWQQQYDKLTRWIAELEALPSMHGTKWKERMLAHYRARLRDLESQRPAGLRKK